MTSADQRECFAPWASPWLSGSQRATKLSPFLANSCFSVLARFVKGHASNQIGFYKIPTGRHGGRSHWQKPRSGHDPKQVETILAEVEGQSKRYIDEMLGGDFPLQPEARYRLSMYVAVQMTPG